MITYYEDSIIAEVYRHRAELLDEYGGIDGYIQHVLKEQDRLKQAGYEFVNPEVLAASCKEAR